MLHLRQRTKTHIFLWLIFILPLILCACDAEIPDVYIFADINECSTISELANHSGSIELYHSPNSDKNLKDSAYTNFYACKYSGEYSFELFAYEFVDDETAKAYYERANSRPCTQSASFTSVTGMFHYELCVVNGNKAYFIKSNRESADEVTDLLSNTFSIKI